MSKMSIKKKLLISPARNYLEMIDFGLNHHFHNKVASNVPESRLLLSCRVPWVGFALWRRGLWWESCLSLTCGTGCLLTPSSTPSPTAARACWVTSFPGTVARWRCSVGSLSSRLNTAIITLAYGSEGSAEGHVMVIFGVGEAEADEG